MKISSLINMGNIFYIKELLKIKINLMKLPAAELRGINSSLKQTNLLIV